MTQYNFTLIRERQNKSRFQRARRVTEKLVRILSEKYKVSKIVLIGSCLDEGHFHSRSDIDLCVEGLSDSDYFRALGDLIAESEEFGVDLIPMEDATERMRAYCGEGEIVYERK
ncbi:MAG: nucleotidyltransferase domain-containing protein [Nitrospirae bacterium]|nr:nucleotidyltransferase domain-containing protein [Nitrospirota bacterium]